MGGVRPACRGGGHGGSRRRWRERRGGGSDAPANGGRGPCSPGTAGAKRPAPAPGEAGGPAAAGRGGGARPGAEWRHRTGRRCRHLGVIRTDHGPPPRSALRHAGTAGSVGAAGGGVAARGHHAHAQPSAARQAELAAWRRSRPPPTGCGRSFGVERGRRGVVRAAPPRGRPAPARPARPAGRVRPVRHPEPGPTSGARRSTATRPVRPTARMRDRHPPVRRGPPPKGPTTPTRQAGLAACVRYSPGVLPNHLRNARWKPTALW